MLAFIILYVCFGLLVAYGVAKAFKESMDVLAFIGWPVMLLPVVRDVVFIGWSGDVDKAWAEYYANLWREYEN